MAKLLILFAFTTTPVVVGVDYVPVHQPCLLTYYADKSFACDRIFQVGFQ